MAKLRWRFLSLLCWLGLFFNIEQFAFPGSERLAMAPGVYLLGLLAAGLPLIPLVQRWSLLTLSVPAVTLYFIVVALDTPMLFGGMHTYVTFTGLFLLIGTIFLSSQVRQALDEFYKAVEIVTLSDNGRQLHNIDEAQQRVEVEMSRSRRTQRPLSLIIIQADKASINMSVHQLVQDVQRSMMQRYVLAMAARFLTRTLRRTDLVVEDDVPGRLVIVAPETTGQEAAALGERIERQLNERLGIGATFSAASFPNQGLTFEGLLSSAEQGLSKQPVIQSETSASVLRNELIGRSDDRAAEPAPASAAAQSSRLSETTNGALK